MKDVSNNRRAGHARRICYLTHLLLLRWQFLGIVYLCLVELLLGLRILVCLSALLVSPCRGRLISLLVRLVRLLLLFCWRLFWRVCLIRLLVLLRLPLVALRGGIDAQSHQTGCYGCDQRAQNGRDTNQHQNPWPEADHEEERQSHQPYKTLYPAIESARIHRAGGSQQRTECQAREK